MTTLSAIVARAPYGLAAWLLLWGLWGIVTSRHYVHLVLCLSVVQTSTYVLLTAIGDVAGGVAPVYAGVTPGTPAVDPVVQAMMLTDVVVEATVVALLLALVVRIHERTGTLDPDDLQALRG
jgi:multicomponent Na+:H+ antiporter subunit C